MVCVALEAAPWQSQPRALTLTCGPHGPSIIPSKEVNTRPQRTVHGGSIYPGNAPVQPSEHRVEERDSEQEAADSGPWERFLELGAYHVGCTLESSVLCTPVLFSDDDITHTLPLCVSVSVILALPVWQVKSHFTDEEIQA